MKTAIISGASRGIGAKIAQQLAKNGYLVIVNYNNSQQKAQQLCDDIKSQRGMAVAYKADMSKPDEIKAMTDYVQKDFGTIDLVVANAGIGLNSLLIDTTDEQIHDLIYTNMVGTITLCRECAKHMLKNHKGNIITISSMWGQVGASCESVYSATKGGIISFTKAIAKELGYNGIRANCIAPGLIDTEINSNLSGEDIQSLVDETPVGRIGTTQDIANAVLWLASEESGFVTGQVISVNGGMII